MTSTEITVTVVASIFGLVLTILNILQFFKNDKKDDRTSAREIAQIQTDVKYIKDGIAEIKSLSTLLADDQTKTKIKIQKIEDQANALDARIKKLEESQPAFEKLRKRGA